MAEAAEKVEVQEEEKQEQTRTTVKEPMGERRAPKPGSKKDKVFQAGRTKEGGSIKALAEEMNCTTSNVRQHIAQCHTKLGYGYNIEGDTFFITGETTQEYVAPEPKPKPKKKKESKAEESESDEDDDFLG